MSYMPEESKLSIADDENEAVQPVIQEAVKEFTDLSSCTFNEVKARLKELSNSELIALTVNLIDGYDKLLKTVAKYA